MKTTLVIFVLAACVSTLAAQAQERGPRGNRGSIFDRVDANKDAFIDLAELKEFRANMQRGPRGNRGPGGPNAENQETSNEGEAATPAPEGNRGGRGPGNRGPRELPSAEEIMKTQDKDEDGKLSRDEFSMGNPRQGRGPGRGQGEGAQAPE